MASPTAVEWASAAKTDLRRASSVKALEFAYPMQTGIRTLHQEFVAVVEACHGAAMDSQALGQKS